jgi:hypothetical protein
MGRILDKYMMKRKAGGVTKHASVCTKNDLSLLVRYLYVNATCPTDYQDAALVSTLWYVFGRASDFILVQKESMPVSSNRNFFTKLVRVETTEQQGLTLYPDNDITTCPILAISVALAMQTAPCPQLLEHVHSAPHKLDLDALESLPLWSSSSRPSKRNQRRQSLKRRRDEEDENATRYPQPSQSTSLSCRKPSRCPGHALVALVPPRWCTTRQRRGLNEHAVDC